MNPFRLNDTLGSKRFFELSKYFTIRSNFLDVAFAVTWIPAR
jgi:hypothetical protein